MIDWALLSQILTSISALLITVFAFLGLRSWRTQLAGTSQFKLASKVVKRSLEVRSDYYKALNAIRRAHTVFAELDTPGTVFTNADLVRRVAERDEEMLILIESIKRSARAARNAEVLLNETFEEFIGPSYDLGNGLLEFMRIYNATLALSRETALEDTRKTMQLMKVGDPFDHDKPRQVAELAKKRMAKYLHGSWWRMIFGG